MNTSVQEGKKVEVLEVVETTDVKDLVVFNDFILVIISSVPVRLPSVDETESVSYWIRFLSHVYPYLFSSINYDGNVV